MKMKYCKKCERPIGRNGASRDMLCPPCKEEHGDIATLPTPESEGVTPNGQEEQTEETQES